MKWLCLSSDGFLESCLLPSQCPGIWRCSVLNTTTPYWKPWILGTPFKYKGKGATIFFYLIAAKLCFQCCRQLSELPTAFSLFSENPLFFRACPTMQHSHKEDITLHSETSFEKWRRLGGSGEGCRQLRKVLATLETALLLQKGKRKF